MKIILSRKGFDAGYGGFPSPILPDGTLLSLPIPSYEKCRYSQLMACEGHTYADIMRMLSPTIRDSGTKIKMTDRISCHLDPDTRQSAKRRAQGWRAAFGQASAAQTHLRNQGVGGGDVFLFFGWFRQTEFYKDKLRFVAAEPGVHIIFAYLQIDRVIDGYKKTAPAWLHEHPHITNTFDSGSNNAIYIAKKHLSWDKARKGYGVFTYTEDLVLTKPGLSRSRWDLPALFKKTNISYHDQSSWKNGYFQSAAKGQEFVARGTAPVVAWTKRLFCSQRK